jgi:hypothetical protein
VRLFIRHRKDGEIVSAAKVNVLPEGLEHPFAELSEDEQVLDLEPNAELAALEPHEILERYLVRGKQLDPKGEPPPRRSGGRRDKS